MGELDDEKRILAGRRVLILEDDYWIARAMELVLRSAQIDVVGPFSAVDAVPTSFEPPLDAAVLDINVQGALSYELADRLAAQSIPFVFTTGYNEARGEYARAPTFVKPVDNEVLMLTLARLIREPLNR